MRDISQHTLEAKVGGEGLFTCLFAVVARLIELPRSRSDFFDAPRKIDMLLNIDKSCVKFTQKLRLYGDEVNRENAFPCSPAPG